MMSKPSFRFRKFVPLISFISIFLLLGAKLIAAQTTAFTYHGKLTDSGNLANTTYDMQFKLFDALSGGTQIGSTLTFDGSGTNPPAVSVTSGVFAITLDFGTCSPPSPCFNGSPRFLEIAVKPHGSGSYTTLTPRQPITATPYAMKTSNLTFNGAYNAGSTIFTATNTFAGEGAGVHTTPDPNLPSFPGKFNSFYGAGAGQSNTGGFNNAFFGYLAGQANTTGTANAFFGYLAGFSNTEGASNAFFGLGAGFNHTTGQHNTFIGGSADFNSSNPTGDNNTLLGFGSKVPSGISNATAIGANAQVTQSNSLVLGSINGINNATADTNVGIGTTAPTERLHVVGNGLFTGNLTVNGTTGGTLTGSIVNAVNQVNINGLRAFTVNGAYDDGSGTVFTATNTFTGEGAGVNTTPNPNLPDGAGKFNSFYGAGAGQANTTGRLNAFFGYQAGQQNPTGSYNAFFGSFAGQQNATGSLNAFFGYAAGKQNTTGGGNAFFGSLAGFSNTIGTNNDFFGYFAGNANTTGGYNAFFGSSAGKQNTTGLQNAFYGASAGNANTTGNNDAFFGYQAGFSNTTASGNTFFGNQAGQANTTGGNNAFFGYQAGFNTSTGINNTFIGNGADFNSTNPTGDSNTLLGSNTKLNTGLFNATAIGANAAVTQINSLILGSINGVNGAASDTLVGIGTTAPQHKLHVEGGFLDAVYGNSSGGIGVYGASTYNFGVGVYGDSTNYIGVYGHTANANGWAGYFFGNVAVTGTVWQGSDARLKQNINNLGYGLAEVLRLRPVSWRWKAHPESGEQLGLIAQEVEPVLPELVSTAKDAEQTKGLNYTGLLPVLINAVKELKAENDQLKQRLNDQQASAALQQQQLQQQQTAIHQQRQEMEAMKKLLCASQPQADFCKAKSVK